MKQLEFNTFVINTTKFTIATSMKNAQNKKYLKSIDTGELHLSKAKSKPFKTTNLGHALGFSHPLKKI